eukprot:448243_1
MARTNITINIHLNTSIVNESKDTFPKSQENQIDTDSSIETIETILHDSLDTPIETIESKPNHHALFICYLFGCIYFGGMEALPSSLFDLLIIRLNVTQFDVSTLFMLRLISYSISCIVAAYILDSFVNTHKLNAFVMIIGAISTLLIGYTNDINLQYIWWIIQGFACGHIETCLPVYIYRIYDDNADNVLNVFLVIYGITKTLTPLLIQYIFLDSLFIFFFVGIIFCAFACYIPTPKHDKFRSIQKEINKQNSTRQAKDVLSEIDLNYKYIKYALIILFCLILITFSCIGAGLITFITVYCSNYLKINSSIGRYLISAYFGGQLLYRMCKIIIISKTNNCMVNNIKLSINSLVIGYLGCFCMFVLWFFYPINGDKNSIILLFFVFFLNGIFLSSTYPSTYQLCESITPI